MDINVQIIYMYHHGHSANLQRDTCSEYKLKHSPVQQQNLVIMFLKNMNALFWQEAHIEHVHSSDKVHPGVTKVHVYPDNKGTLRCHFKIAVYQ